MSNRRTFLKQSLLSSTLLVPAAVRREAAAMGSEASSNAHKPLFLSTWNHGIAANARAWEVLHDGGSILDAVEQGVMVTEADLSSRSVGLAGNPDREGIVTLDACIMKGDGSCGGVCFLRQVKHPISVARMVMERTPHVLLAGEGARQFAISQGVPMEVEELQPSVRRAWERWLEHEEYKPIINIENHDTIGMVGIDAQSRMAGTCTTSGLAYKMHGRVGDSPIIGAGLYVDEESGAATATGLGETIIKVAGSFLVVEYMRQGRSPAEACKAAVDRLIHKNRENIENMQAGFIAINKDGEYGGYAVHPGFNYAVHTVEGNVMVDAQSHFSS